MGILTSKEKTPAGGTVTISYTILGIGLTVLVIAMAIILILDYNSEWNIELREYISICTFSCVTIGLIYNAVGLQYNYELNKQKAAKEDLLNDAKKIQLTYDAITEWYKRDMADNADRTRELLKPYKNKLSNPNVLEEFKELLERPSSVQARMSFTCVLNYFEHLSLLCKDCVIDEATLKKAFRTAFITYYTTLKEYIEDERRGNNGANHMIYINFVELTKTWLIS